MIQCFRKFCLFFVVFVCVNHQSIWSYVLPNSYRNSYRNSYSAITDRKISSKSSEKYAVPDWLVGDGSEQNLRPKVTVKFVNTVSGKDVVAEVDQGSNLLAVGDSVGVELPRACRTGLCGSCTCELKDPSAIKTETNPRDGYATIRACSVKCFVPEGMTEMVVDVGRMKKRKSRTVGDSTTLSVETEDEVVVSNDTVDILIAV